MLRIVDSRSAVLLPYLLLLVVAAPMAVYRYTSWNIAQRESEPPKPVKNLGTQLREDMLAKHRPPPAMASLAQPGFDDMAPAAGATDAFGNPLDANRNPLAGDPCQGHTKPDFLGIKMQALCRDYGANTDQRCREFVNLAYELGDDSIDPVFKAPAGCQP